MTVQEIIEQVRWCFDEEKANISLLSGIDENDDTYMDNIIKAKINDSLRWCLLYAPSELLDSDTSTETDEGLLSSSVTDVTSGTPTVITLPVGFMRLIRVRLPDWHKAVRVPIEEDSDEYLMLSDDTARATNDRPVAALIRTSPKKLELWPGGSSTDIEISYVNHPNFTVPESESETINVPDKIVSAFIYYIAYLVMSAYGDSKAANMLGIAKMNLGLQ